MITIHIADATKGALAIVHRPNSMHYSKETIVKLWTHSFVHYLLCLYVLRKSAQCMSWSAKYKEDVERRISIFNIFVIQLRFSYIWMTDVKSIYYITKQLISARHCCKNSEINNRIHRSRSLETVSYESNLMYVFTSSSCI